MDYPDNVDESGPSLPAYLKGLNVPILANRGNEYAGSMVPRKKKQTRSYQVMKQLWPGEEPDR
jgi:hypothetical protein